MDSFISPHVLVSRSVTDLSPSCSLLRCYSRVGPTHIRRIRGLLICLERLKIRLRNQQLPFLALIMMARQSTVLG